MTLSFVPKMQGHIHTMHNPQLPHILYITMKCTCTPDITHIPYIHITHIPTSSTYPSYPLLHTHTPYIAMSSISTSNTYKHHTLPHRHSPLFIPILNVHTIYTYHIMYTPNAHHTHTAHTSYTHPLYIHTLSQHILSILAQTHYNIYSPILYNTQAHPITYAPTPCASCTPKPCIGCLQLRAYIVHYAQNTITLQPSSLQAFGIKLAPSWFSSFFLMILGTCQVVLCLNLLTYK